MLLTHGCYGSSVPQLTHRVSVLVVGRLIDTVDDCSGIVSLKFEDVSESDDFFFEIF